MTLLHAKLNVKLISLSKFSHDSTFSSESMKQNPFKLIRAIVHNLQKEGSKLLFFFFK